jgi:DNA-directed RNA polymerase specialized sigma24 family protein
MDARTRREVTELTTRPAEGDRSAFDPLFDTLWPFLRAFARRMLGDAAEADDAAQQALLRGFARASEYEAGRDALPWIVAIAANACRTLRNRRSRRREDAIAGVDRVAPAADLEAAQLEAAAVELMGELPAADLATCGPPGSATRDRTSPTRRSAKRVQRATERLRDLWRTRHGAP